MRKLLIIGSGGHGRVIADIAMQLKRWKEIAFLDDDENIKSSMGFRVIGKSYEALNFIQEYDLFVAIGNRVIREKMHQKIKAEGCIMPTLVHPSAIIGTQVQIGEGTVIMAGVVINCCSKIGDGCILNTAASIDHDCIIDDYVHISPGAKVAGTVSIGRGTWIGIGAIVSNNIGISKNVVVGAGAVVIKNIQAPGVYIGVPARNKDLG